MPQACEERHIAHVADLEAFRSVQAPPELQVAPGLLDVERARCVALSEVYARPPGACGIKLEQRRIVA